MGKWERVVPPSTIAAIRAFVDQGVPPSDFVKAVLENNLKEACAQADDRNRRVIFEIAGYCYNEIPAACWGSPEHVHAWLVRMGTA